MIEKGKDTCYNPDSKDKKRGKIWDSQNVNGGGYLDSRGFAVSGILYPILILTLFLIVQILTMMASRKIVLDKNKKELLDSVNASNKIYTNEEISILVDGLTKRVTTLENAIKDSQLQLVKNVDPLLLQKAGKYYIDGIINSPYGTSGYIEVELSSDPKWRRVVYKYNSGSAIFENILKDDSWRGWKLISGEVELWTGSITPSDTKISFAYHLSPYGTLRFMIDGGEYSIDTVYDPNTSWGGGVTGWAVPTDKRNELVGIGYYILKDAISIRSIEKHIIMDVTVSWKQDRLRLTKIIGRP